MPLANEKLLISMIYPPNKEWLAKVAQRFPGVEVLWEECEFQSMSKGVKPLEELPADVKAGSTMMCVMAPPPSSADMSKVRFIQLVTAGSDLWLNHPAYTDPNVAICSGNGAHSPQMAAWVIGTWLSYVHDLQTYVEFQKDEHWEPWKAERYQNVKPDSAGRRVGIAGYGSIGRNCAQLAQALGMEVYAYTKSPKPTAESRRAAEAYLVPGTGDPDGVIPARWFHGDFDDFIAQDLDFLIISLPLYSSTRGLLGKSQFEILHSRGRKTFVSNVSRGPIIDTDALIHALEGGLIGGAAVDVADPEPLPKGHPLWKAPNAFVSPHMSWQSGNFPLRILDIVYKNLERLENGEPLLNAVKKV